MRVCYVTHYSGLTGANQSLLDILTGIEKFGIKPYVVLREKGLFEEELKRKKIPCIIIPYKNDIKGNNIIKNSLKPIYNHFYAYKLKKYLLENEIDIVHNNSFVCGIGMKAALLARLPYICHNREFIYEDFNQELLNEKRSLYLLSRADAVIEISEAINQKFSNLVPDANFYILHDGIDIKRYYHIHSPILYGSQINILFAGQLASGKGQMQAVQALESLQKKGYQNINLTLVGGGKDSEYGKHIFEYIEKHHITNITYEDFCDLSEFRKKSDIILVCSKLEGLGRVTIEGQLSGCLVIGAATGGTKEIITDDETGLLYEYGNINNLADKILYAIHNPEKMNQIAKNGQSMAVINFDMETYNYKLSEIYKKIISSKK